MIGAADAQSTMTKSVSVPAIKPGTNTSFAPLKQIEAGVLNVGYAEAGPADGPPVFLFHGWPYDIYKITVPTITMEGDANGAPHPPAGCEWRAPPARRGLREKVFGQIRVPTHHGRHRHNLPQEAPQAFAQAVVDVDRF